MHTYIYLYISANTVFNAVEIETHAGNSIYMFLNLALTGVPVRIHHFFHPVIYAVLYVLFTVFYHLADGTNANYDPFVYPVINWNDPGNAAMYGCLVALVATPLMHLVVYGVYALRMLIHRSCCSKPVGYDSNSVGNKDTRELEENNHATQSTEL
jgi:hypothetical protein